MLPEVRTAARMSYREAGAPHAPALVLLHGIGSTSAAWRLQYADLAGEYRVIGWDAPGYGQSVPLEGEAPAPQAYAEALGRLLDAIGVQQALVGSNSWGTPTAVAFARLAPPRVRGLVLGGPAAGWGHLPGEERDRLLAARLDRLNAMGVTRMREDDAGRLVAPGTRDEVVHWIRSGEGVYVGGYSQAARMMARADVARDAAGLGCPVTIVSGELDVVTPPQAHARRIAAAVPHAKFVAVPGCGHLPHLEFPERFNAELRAIVA